MMTFPIVIMGGPTTVYHVIVSQPAMHAGQVIYDVSQILLK